MENKALKVQYRGGFSDRMGIKPENAEIQINNLDHRTRVALINKITALLGFVKEFNGSDTLIYSFYVRLMSEVYLEPIKHYGSYLFSDDEKEMLSAISNTISTDTYDSVLTLVEFIANFFEKASKEYAIPLEIYPRFNDIFQKEYVGYRFIDSKIVPISDNQEAEEIENALEVGFDNVHKHLGKAMLLLSDRDKPDYENSIKESITAVEAMCCIISGNNSTLGDTLKKIKKDGRIDIHPCLEEAFRKIYGYTSNDNAGIRHAAGMGGKDSTFAEARFMLVSCSAFINYLKIVSMVEN